MVGMDDGLLAFTDIEEALSEAYATAIAAHAGYVIAKRNFDRDGVDITIEAGDNLRPKIDVQLKATVNLKGRGAVLPFPCPRRNYDLLRIPTQTPRILVVLHLPKDPEKWLSVNPARLVLRNCAYWMSLRDAPETDVKDNKTVYIPKANRLDVPGLKALMEQSRTGVIR
jgi:hypothetical protein